MAGPQGRAEEHTGMPGRWGVEMGDWGSQGLWQALGWMTGGNSKLEGLNQEADFPGVRAVTKALGR
jgi:hypothetical protein